MFVNTNNFIPNSVYILDEKMNSQTKQIIISKIESYVQRAEKITQILKNGPRKKKTVASTANARGNVKYEDDNDSPDSDDDDSTDRDRKRMMQKFKGKIHFLNLSFIPIEKFRSNHH
jgi:hypothetical protein